MTKLTPELAQELYGRYYIGESRAPKWIAEENGLGVQLLVDQWIQKGLRIRNRSESSTAWRQVGKPWRWSDQTPGPSTNGTRPAVAEDKPIYEVDLPKDAPLPIRLRLTVGDVRLEIEIGK